MDSFLTINEICGLLKVQRDTVLRWICSGRLKAFKPGGGRFWRVARVDFQRFIKGGPEFAAQFIKGENHSNIHDGVRAPKKPGRVKGARA